MTLKDFRKLLLGCNPDAEIVFSLTTDVQSQECEVSNVIEENATDNTRAADPKINVVLKASKK